MYLVGAYGSCSFSSKNKSGLKRAKKGGIMFRFWVLIQPIILSKLDPLRVFSFFEARLACMLWKIYIDDSVMLSRAFVSYLAFRLFISYQEFLYKRVVHPPQFMVLIFNHLVSSNGFDYVNRHN
jgi:hypothetical protein